MSMKDHSFISRVVCKLKRKFAGKRRDLAKFGTPDETGHIEMPLSCMAPGEFGHVIGLKGAPETRQRFLELGFTAGAEVDFIRTAPLGDPITVRIRGYQLSLRGKEAEVIWMRRCPPKFDDYNPEGISISELVAYKQIALGSRES